MNNDTLTPAQGLTSVEARDRLDRIGPNKPSPSRQGVGLLHLLTLFANPLAIVLIIAAGISALVGEVTSSIIIILMVLVGIGINFFQTLRSHRAIQRLRETVALTATVRRDGKWKEVPRHEVVPDDVIQLSAGDLVPADCRLLRSRDLHVQQAALTGESLPVEKEASDRTREGTARADDPGLVFLGTSIISGTATAVVFATGNKTGFGDIAARLSERAPETEFERGTRRFGLFITQTVLVLVFFVFLVDAVMKSRCTGIAAVRHRTGSWFDT